MKISRHFETWDVIKYIENQIIGNNPELMSYNLRGIIEEEISLGDDMQGDESSLMNRIYDSIEEMLEMEAYEE